MRPLVRTSVLVCACAAAFSSIAEPQAVLTRAPIDHAETCLGKSEVQTAPASASDEVTIAVLTDTLTAEELGQVRKDIAGFFQSTKNKIPFRLAALSGGEPQLFGPFKTRALLQKSLDEITVAADATQKTPLQFYAGLTATVPQLGSNWSNVILVGRFPAVGPDLAPFTEAWLSDRTRAAKIRVSYWTPSGDASEIMNAAAPPTGGMRLDDGIAQIRELVDQQDLPREVSWPAPAPPESFRVCQISLIGANGVPVINIPSVAAASGVKVPNLEGYATLVSSVKTLAEFIQTPFLSAEQEIKAEETLNVAMEIAPREESTLRLGADLYRRTGSDPKLASILGTLTEIAPGEAALFAELGHLRYRMGEWDAADRVLLRSRELKPGDPSVAEELARIRLTRGDDRGAINFLEERLSIGNPTQELWLLRADTATRIGDWQRTADSLEHALPMGGISLERRTSLVRIYMQHQMADQALLHIRTFAGTLPPDAAIRTEYAQYLDDLHQPEDALAAWRRTLEADGRSELAHFRVTRLLIEKPDLTAALTAADNGIEAAPGSGRLYLAKAEILEKTGRFYDARRTLRDAAPNVADQPLLARLADMEDAGGQGAAGYYRQVAESGESDTVLHADALKRGLAAALRDGDLENAAWFQTALGANIRPASASRRTGTVVIPGGLEALAFAAQAKTASPDVFLVEYARAVIPRLRVFDKKAVEAFQEKIHEHFRRIADVSALGSPQPGHITVTLSVQDKNSQRVTEKVLDLLGWKVRASRQGVKLDPPAKASKASRQETASALTIDEIGMQSNLESGKPFAFEIPMGTATVVLGEEPWKMQFYAKENYPGGLAEAIASNLPLAETYAALGQMDPTLRKC